MTTPSKPSEEAVEPFESKETFVKHSMQEALNFYWGKGGVQKDQARAAQLFATLSKQYKHLPATCALGFAFLHGNGVPKDADRAVRLFVRAHKEGLVEATYQLACCAYTGTGMAQDYKFAFQAFETLSRNKYVLAHNSLGKCYLHGHGVNQDAAEAARLFRLGAAVVDPSAIHSLATCYETGRGVIKNKHKAITLYSLAYQKGHEESRFCWAKLLYEVHTGDRLVDEKNAEDAFTAFSELHAKHPSAETAFALGMCFFEGRGVRKVEGSTALAYFREAAEADFAPALFYIGRMHDQGHDDVKKDMNVAIAFYTGGAKLGDSKAQHALGGCYEYGEGVRRDVNRAARLYAEAAKSGLPEGKYSLARCYHLGQGVTHKSMEQAIKLYQAASDDGYALAQYRLGTIFRDGDGVQKNRELAFALFTKANLQGHKQASDALEALLSE